MKLNPTNASWRSCAVLLGAGLTCLIHLTQPTPLRAATPEPEPVETGPTSAASQASRAGLAPNVAEVVRLAESGMEESVLLSFIERSPTRFELSADDIIYLKDVGIEAPVITAMLRHAAPPAAPEPTPAPKPQPAPVVAAPTTTTTPSPPEPTPVYVTNAPPEVTHFYDTLSPYGTWVEVDGMGWCWQPRVMVVNRSWRPYCDSGRWIYSDCGWYWHSDYSWGWAPFHYGRWHHHHRHGWVWFPDLVWAPAWVTWRYSDAYCGWAPLPPGARFVIGHGWSYQGVSVGIDFDFRLGFGLFSFVEIGHLHNPHPRLHLLPPPRVREIHGITRVLNNHAPGPNHSIRNPGISVDRVSSASHQQIRPVAVREVNAPAAGLGRELAVKRDGTPTAIFRPRNLPAPQTIRPAAQRVDERTAIVRPPPQRPAPRIAPGFAAPSSPRSEPTRPVPPVKPTQPTQPTQPVPPTRPAKPAVTPRPRPETVRPQNRERPAPGAPSRPAPQSAAAPSLAAEPAAPAQPMPAVKATPPAAPWVRESPKGRELRISNGRPIPATPHGGRSVSQKSPRQPGSGKERD